MRMTRYRALRKDVLEHFGFGTKNMKRYKICPCCGNVQAAKNKLCKVCQTKLRRKQFLIFTKQSIVAAPNAKMFSLMMRSIALCAGRNRIMKESQYKDVKIPEDVTPEAGDKIFLWENLKTMRPLCDALR